MINDGKEWCVPAQQGLACIDNHAAAGMHAVTSNTAMKAEPILAIPGVHIAPPGTSDRMPMRWARWLSGSRWWCVQNRHMHAHTWSSMWKMERGGHKAGAPAHGKEGWNWRWHKRPRSGW